MPLLQGKRPAELRASGAAGAVSRPGAGADPSSEISPPLGDRRRTGQPPARARTREGPVADQRRPGPRPPALASASDARLQPGAGARPPSGEEIRQASAPRGEARQKYRDTDPPALPPQARG